MLAYSQILVVVACSIGLILFLFVNWFTIRRLQYEDRRARAQQVEQPVVTLVHAEMIPPHRTAEDIEREKELALFYTHQEQVRRLLDAKIDVIKDAAATHNKIALIQAEVVKFQAEKEVRMVEAGIVPSQAPAMMLIDHGRVLEVDENGNSAPLMAGADSEVGRSVVLAHGQQQDDDQHSDHLLGSLAHQQRSMRTEAERQLAMIDEQMSDLPGKSMSGWVRAQYESTRD